MLYVLAGILGYAYPVFKAHAAELRPPEMFSLQQKIEAEPGRPSVHRMGLAAGRFLVAGTEMLGSSFRRTVVLLLDHGWHGAMGVVINRPSRVRLGQVLQSLPADQEWAEHLFWGGPVAAGTLLMLMRSAKPAEGISHVVEDLFWVQDSSLLEQILEKGWPAQRIHLYAGYAGWAPGQLEDEIMRGSWHIVPADASAVFGAEPLEIWRDLFFQSTSKWGLLRRYGPKTREMPAPLLIPSLGGETLSFWDGESTEVRRWITGCLKSEANFHPFRNLPEGSTRESVS